MFHSNVHPLPAARSFSQSGRKTSFAITPPFSPTRTSSRSSRRRTTTFTTTPVRPHRSSRATSCPLRFTAKRQRRHRRRQKRQRRRKRRSTNLVQNLAGLKAGPRQSSATSPSSPDQESSRSLTTGVRGSVVPSPSTANCLPTIWSGLPSERPHATATAQGITPTIAFPTLTSGRPRSRKNILTSWISFVRVRSWETTTSMTASSSRRTTTSGR